MQNLSWHLSSNINDLRNLFSQVILPYDVDTYVCSCGHIETIIKDQNSITDKYICSSCENENFYDANKYLNNYFWYDKIDELLNEEYIFSLEPNTTYDDKTKILKSIIQINIPNSIDLASNKPLYKPKTLFEIQIDEFGNIKEVLHANFDLDSLLTNNERNGYPYISEQELINRNPFLIGFKKKILKTFIQNSNYFKSKILHKTSSIEEFAYFVTNHQLLDIEFYKWKDIDLLPNDKKFTIIDGLDYVLNYRVEKTLKKLVFENYKLQLKEYKCYDFIYIHSIAKYIKDVNILNRMINIDLKSHIDMMNNSYYLISYVEFLSSKFTDKQIENLFISYSKKELFWLIDSVSIFSEVIDYLDEFEVTKCKVENLHDDIIRFHQIILNKHLIDVKFDYEDKFLNACTNIEDYQIKLPFDGMELYTWSNKLQNCLSGYWKPILEKRTIVYGFFIDNEIKFAVEIKNNKIVQSKSKYNQDLQIRETSLVMGWFTEYFEEKNDENIIQNQS